MFPRPSSKNHGEASMTLYHVGWDCWRVGWALGRGGWEFTLVVGFVGRWEACEGGGVRGLCVRCTW